MKKHFIAVFLIALVCGMTATAQQFRKPKVKVDSLSSYNVATQTVKNTRGYDARCYFSDCLEDINKSIQILFKKTMDSVKIQGGTWDFGSGIAAESPLSSGRFAANFGVTAGKVDTIWTDLEVNPGYQVSGFAGGTTYVPKHDTTCTWLTPVMTDRMKFDVNLDKFHYPVYRVVSAVADTGKVYLMYKRPGNN